MIAYLSDEEFANSEFKDGIEKRKDNDRMEVWYYAPEKDTY